MKSTMRASVAIVVGATAVLMATAPSASAATARNGVCELDGHRPLAEAVHAGRALPEVGPDGTA